MRSFEPATRRAALNSSAVCELGTRKIVAPVALTATVFCRKAPIAPIDSSPSIVPVAATLSPPVSSPGVNSSRSARVKDKPADGPPIKSVLIPTSNGKSTFRVSAGHTPMIVRFGSSGLTINSIFFLTEFSDLCGVMVTSTTSPGE